MHHQDLIRGIDTALIPEEQQIKGDIKIPVTEGALHDLFADIGLTSSSYVEVFKRIKTRIRRKASEIIDPIQKEKTLALADYLEETMGDSRGKIRKYFGVEVFHEQEQAYREFMTVLKTKELVPITNGQSLTDEELLQSFYDQFTSASETVKAMATTIEAHSKLKNKYRTHFSEALRKIQSGSHARFLSQRGVKIDADKAYMDTQKNREKWSQQGVTIRLAGMKKYTSLSPMKREEYRIEQAYKKNWEFAGRRIGLRDVNGHYPFFTSTYDANFARVLTSRGISWLYKPTAWTLNVPEDNEDIRQKNLLVEPEFYIPEEELFIMIVAFRKHFHGALLDFTIANQKGRIKIIQGNTQRNIKVAEVSTCGGAGIKKNYKFNFDGDVFTINNIDRNLGNYILIDCSCQVCRLNKEEKALA